MRRTPDRPGSAGRDPLITLLTDFGQEDVFVGVMKGVIAGISPRARIIDITHGIRPQDVAQGGLRWASAVPFFPPGAVHVAVVDPGVGGERAIVALRARGATFLAPDNGLLGAVAAPAEIEEAVRVEEERYFLPALSRTFHGRDIFAPVAARLSLGLPLRKLGPPAGGILRLPDPPLRGSGRRLEGRIVDIDNFGNYITNIPAGSGGFREVRAGKRRIPVTAGSYCDVRPGEAVVVVGSSGFLEIAVSRGRADRKLGLRRGQPVVAIRI